MFKAGLLALQFSAVDLHQKQLAAALGAVQLGDQHLYGATFCRDSVDLTTADRQRQEQPVSGFHPLTHQFARCLVHEQDSPGAPNGNHWDRNHL